MDRLLTPKEVAEYLNLQLNTLAKRRASGEGPPFVKLGTAQGAPVRYKESDIQQYLSTSDATSNGRVTRRRVRQ